MFKIFLNIIFKYYLHNVLLIFLVNIKNKIDYENVINI